MKIRHIVLTSLRFRACVATRISKRFDRHSNRVRTTNKSRWTNDSMIFFWALVMFKRRITCRIIDDLQVFHRFWWITHGPFAIWTRWEIRWKFVRTFHSRWTEIHAFLLSSIFVTQIFSFHLVQSRKIEQNVIIFIRFSLSVLAKKDTSSLVFIRFASIVVSYAKYKIFLSNRGKSTGHEERNHLFLQRFDSCNQCLVI